MNNLHMTRLEDADSTDYYPTPQHATFALIEKERIHLDKHFIGSSFIWEPAAGRGWMSIELMRLGYPVISSDIVAVANCMVPLIQHDFLEDRPRWLSEPAAIITNPPYARDMAQKFAEKALTMAPYTAMLCRATWVESQTRYKFFSEKPPTRILFFSRRFSCTESYFGTGKENGGMVPYAWFVWDKLRPGPTTVDWIDPDVYERWKENTVAKSR